MSAKGHLPRSFCWMCFLLLVKSLSFYKLHGCLGPTCFRCMFGNPIGEFIFTEQVDTPMHMLTRWEICSPGTTNIHPCMTRNVQLRLGGKRARRTPLRARMHTCRACNLPGPTCSPCCTTGNDGRLDVGTKCPLNQSRCRTCNALKSKARCASVRQSSMLRYETPN